MSELDLPCTRFHQVFLLVMEISSKIYTDQTVRLPVTYARGYKCMMVAYEQDSNSIMVDPTKSKEGTYLKRAYKLMQKTLKDRGLKPKTHILDNECSNTLKFLMS